MRIESVALLLLVIGAVSTIHLQRNNHLDDQSESESTLSSDAMARVTQFMYSDPDILASLSEGKELTYSQQQRVNQFMLDDSVVGPEMLTMMSNTQGMEWIKKLSPEKQKKVIGIYLGIGGSEESNGDISQMINKLLDDPEIAAAFPMADAYANYTPQAEGTSVVGGNEAEGNYEDHSQNYENEQENGEQQNDTISADDSHLLSMHLGMLNSVTKLSHLIVAKI